MKKDSEYTDNNALLHYRNYHPKDRNTVYSFVEIIGNNKPIDNIEDMFTAANSVANILAFLEFGLSDHSSDPHIPQEVIHEGASEIVRACRLVTRRIEDYAFTEHDKAMFPEAYARKKEAQIQKEAAGKGKTIPIAGHKSSEQ